MRLFGILVAWGAFVLILIPALNFATRSDPGEPSVEANTDFVSPVARSTPDVVVVVLDAYGSNEVLSRFHGFDNSRFYAELVALGVQVGDEVKSNYSITSLSVVSSLNLDYLVGEQHLNRADFEAIYAMLGGDNTLARVLDETGYRQTYVESGWLGTRCRELVRNCVAGPWPDETVYDINLRSLLRGLPGLEAGRSFSRGALNSLRWLENELGSYLGNDVADYIYVHALAPHPPFFLDSSCESTPTRELSGFSTGASWLSDEELALRSAGYANQVRCVNRILTTVAKMAVANDAIVVMFGDHGSDLGGQLYLDGGDWTDEHIAERFGVLFAAYGPGCNFADIGSLVNVSRRVVNCISDAGLEDLPFRAYLPSKGWDLTEIKVPTSDGQETYNVPAR
jgi:hypothetical protein